MPFKSKSNIAFGGDVGHLSHGPTRRTKSTTNYGTGTGVSAKIGRASCRERV